MAETLSNAKVEAVFNKSGLVSLTDKELGKSLEFKNDNFSFTIDNSMVDSSIVSLKSSKLEGNTMRYSFTEGGFNIEVVYELKTDWRFISKQLIITNKNNDTYTVKHIDVCNGRLVNTPKEIYLAGLDANARKSRGLGDYAAFARMDDKWGGMFLVQNPFMLWKFDKGAFSMDYRHRYGMEI